MVKGKIVQLEQNGSIRPLPVLPVEILFYGFRYKCAPFFCVNRRHSENEDLKICFVEMSMESSMACIGRDRQEEVRRLSCSVIFHNDRVPCFSELCPASGYSLWL